VSDIYCTSCGAKVGDTQRFCGSCGTAIGALQVAKRAETTEIPGASGVATTGITCTNCGSEKIQKVSLVHESGTSTISATTMGAAVGTGGIGVGAAKTEGTQTTAISARVAPPPHPHALFLAFGCFFPILVLFGVFGVPWIWFCAVWGTAAALAAYADWQAYKLRPQLLEKWERQYLCLRCGTIMEPGKCA
jgi:DNA-directed RNA polymerase subunit RPC12/RpoP